MVRLLALLSVGSTAKQDEMAALLQNRVMSDVTLLKDKMHHRGDKKVVTKIETLLSAMEGRVNSTVSPLTQAEIDMVSEVITSLDEDFVAQLVYEGGTDTSDYAMKTAAHELCTTHKDRRLHATSGDVTVAKNAVDSARQKHSACRKAEKSFTDYMSSAQDLVDHGTWKKIAKEDDLLAHNSICTQRTTFTSDLGAYSALPPNQISEACVNDQDTFESNQCVWLSSKISTCRAFDECINNVDLAGFKTQIEGRIEQRRSLYLTILKVKCRLSYLVDAFLHNGGASNSTTVDNCNSTVVPTQDHEKFTLTLDVPAVVTCSADADITSDMSQPSLSDSSMCSAWLNAEYDWDIRNYTAITECRQSCQLPGNTIGAANVAGCVDSGPAEECAFYSRHHDACGEYDNATFNAPASCCACGGGTPTPTPAPAQAVWILHEAGAYFGFAPQVYLGQANSFDECAVLHSQETACDAMDFMEYKVTGTCTCSEAGEVNPNVNYNIYRKAGTR